MPEITDGMTADAVWNVIYDILHSVKMADKSESKEVYLLVNDYVSNWYGD